MPPASARTRPVSRSSSCSVACYARPSDQPRDRAAALHASFVRTGWPEDLPPTLSRMLCAKNPARRGGRMWNCFANVESTRLSRQTRRLIVPRLFHLLQPPAIRRRFIFIVEVRNLRTESRRPTAMPGNRRIVNLTSRMNVRISEYCLILTSSALHNVQMRIRRAIDHLISDRSHCLCSSHAASVTNCMTGSPTGE